MSPVSKELLKNKTLQENNDPSFGQVREVNASQAVYGATNFVASLFRKSKNNIATLRELAEEEIEMEELNHRSAMVGTVVELALGGLAILMVLVMAPGALEFIQAQFVFGATRVICWIILILFFIGLYFVFRTLTIVNYEYANLMDIFKKSRKISLENPSRIAFTDLLPRAQYGIVFDKLDSVFRIARDKGVVHHDSLADILLTKHSMQDEIPNFLANSMTMIGLVGTIIGLTGATGGMETLFTSVGDLNMLKEGFQETLQGIDTAFFTTLFGAAGMLVLKYFNIVARKARIIFFTELEQVMLTEILPKMHKISFMPVRKTRPKNRVKRAVSSRSKSQKSTKKVASPRKTVSKKKSVTGKTSTRLASTNKTKVKTSKKPVSKTVVGKKNKK